MNQQQKPTLFTQIMRWLARLGTIVSVALLLLFLFGEGISFTELTFVEGVGFFFFPIGVTLGMLLAWRWETLGGAVTLVSLLGFYMVMYSARGSFPEGIWFALFALPGLVFLICGLRSQQTSGLLRAI